MAQRPSGPTNKTGVIGSDLDAWITVHGAESRPEPKVSSEQYVAQDKTGQNMYLLSTKSLSKSLFISNMIMADTALQRRGLDFQQ